MLGFGGLRANKQPAKRLRHLYLYSPIPPSKTGTADYFEAVAAEIAQYDIDRRRITIVTEQQSGSNASYFGFPVKNGHELPALCQSDETHIFFLANNEHHAFAFQRLLNIRAEPGGRIVSVLHEPSCFMLLNTLSAEERYDFDDDLFTKAMAGQFGGKAKGLISRRRSGRLPFEIEYLAHAQALTLQKSSEVWVHNAFAGWKLYLEDDSADLAKIVISRHPTLFSQDRLPPTGRRSGDDVFTFGLFGWVSPSKRVREVILAFGMALQCVPATAAAKFRLIVVGALPPDSDHDLRSLVSSRSLQNHVTFFEYVSIADFNRLIAECDFIFNLRYPSNGESSGTWERAKELGIPVAVSAYQAFHELDAAYKIPVQSHEEMLSLFSLFLTKFASAGAARSPDGPDGGDVASHLCGEERPDISQLIVRECQRNV